MKASNSNVYIQLIILTNKAASIRKMFIRAILKKKVIMALKKRNFNRTAAQFSQHNPIPLKITTNFTSLLILSQTM